MKAPRMVIGTDRLELYEHLGRRREILQGQSRTWIKLCIGITAAHALIVQVPTMFSRFFGDSVSNTEKLLGAEDQSEIGLKMQRMK